MLLPATPSRPAGTLPRRLPGAVILTIRRQVDYCRVAAALCCPGRAGTVLPD
jgi:hypothetical protein